jgi:ankyrin repeat protein
VNRKHKNGGTAFSLAIENGRVDVVKMLLEHDVDRRIIAGALLEASFMGRDEVVKALLHHKKVDVNCRDKKGITALFVASFSDKLGVVQLLLQHEGLKVNLQNGLGQTALWAACACGNSKIIRTLLRDKRVNVNVKTMKGSTALNVAILKGYDNVVRLLKEHTARVPAVDEIWVPRESELNLMDSGRSNFLLSTECHGRALVYDTRLDGSETQNHWCE